MTWFGWGSTKSEDTQEETDGAVLKESRQKCYQVCHPSSPTRVPALLPSRTALHHAASPSGRGFCPGSSTRETLSKRRLPRGCLPLRRRRPSAPSTAAVTRWSSVHLPNQRPCLLGIPSRHLCTMDFSFAGSGSARKRPAAPNEARQPSKQPREDTPGQRQQHQQQQQPPPASSGSSNAFRFMGPSLRQGRQAAAPSPQAQQRQQQQQQQQPVAAQSQAPPGQAAPVAPHGSSRGHGDGGFAAPSGSTPLQTHPPQLGSQQQQQGEGGSSGSQRGAEHQASRSTPEGPMEVARVAPPPNTILVAPRQQGNPLLRHIRNVRWAMMGPGASSPSGPDYLLGEASAALFLSLRYHLLHPEYIHTRIRGLAPASYKIRVLLCHADTDDCVRPLEAVMKAALRNGLTVLVAWSPEEAARWLETLKAYESKPADAIQERVDTDYLSRLTAALTTVKGVNRTDVATLGRRFGSFAALAGASMEDLSACAGLGPTKVARLHDAFHKPFRKPLRTNPAVATGGAGGSSSSSSNQRRRGSRTGSRASAGT